ncbi:uncharacterized protein LOC143265639 isoform X2 [Megachile rotundata]|uniref:uncharacterized protein LOC143265639 isoform X2 n=1 Tax=Megachile rotundata TaxID=143995 RepID=UPI003FD27B67
MAEAASSKMEVVDEERKPKEEQGREMKEAVNKATEEQPTNSSGNGPPTGALKKLLKKLLYGGHAGRGRGGHGRSRRGRRANSGGGRGGSQGGRGGTRGGGPQRSWRGGRKGGRGKIIEFTNNYKVVL